jgi:hypothetical protein
VRSIGRSVLFSGDTVGPNEQLIVMRHYVPAFLPPSEFLAAAREAAEAVRYEGEIVAPADLDVIVL